MGVLAFLLVLLLCIPIAFLVWKLLNNLLDNMKNQQDASEEVRMRKAAYQGSRKYNSKYDHNRYDHSRYDHRSRYSSDQSSRRNRRDRG